MEKFIKFLRNQFLGIDENDLTKLEKNILTELNRISDNVQNKDIDTNKIENLLWELHRIATDYDNYEHGLPMYTEYELTAMKNAVRKFIADNVQTDINKKHLQGMAILL